MVPFRPARCGREWALLDGGRGAPVYLHGAPVLRAEEMGMWARDESLGIKGPSEAQPPARIRNREDDVDRTDAAQKNNAGADEGLTAAELFGMTHHGC